MTTAHSIATSTAIAVGRATIARSIGAVSGTVITDSSATDDREYSSVQRCRAASVNPTTVTIPITTRTQIPGPPATIGKRGCDDGRGDGGDQPAPRQLARLLRHGDRRHAALRVLWRTRPSSRTARPRSSPGRHSTTGTPWRRNVAIRSSNVSCAMRRAASGSCRAVLREPVRRSASRWCRSPSPPRPARLLADRSSCASSARVRAG